MNELAIYDKILGQTIFNAFNEKDIMNIGIETTKENLEAYLSTFDY